MYKIKQKKSEEAKPPPKYLELREDDDGDIELVCHVADEEDDYPWVILTIYQDGRIKRLESVGKDCGFKLDKDGKVIIA